MLLATDRNRFDVGESAGILDGNLKGVEPCVRINFGAIWVLSFALANLGAGHRITDDNLATLGGGIDSCY